MIRMRSSTAPHKTKDPFCVCEYVIFAILQLYHTSNGEGTPVMNGSMLFASNFHRLYTSLKEEM